MLPLITEEQKDIVFTAIMNDVHSWRKGITSRKKIQKLTKQLLILHQTQI